MQILKIPIKIVVLFTSFIILLSNILVAQTLVPKNIPIDKKEYEHFLKKTAKKLKHEGWKTFNDSLLENELRKIYPLISLNDSSCNPIYLWAERKLSFSEFSYVFELADKSTLNTIFKKIQKSDTVILKTVNNRFIKSDELLYIMWRYAELKKKYLSFYIWRKNSESNKNEVFVVLFVDLKQIAKEVEKLDERELKKYRSDHHNATEEELKKLMGF